MRVYILIIFLLGQVGLWAQESPFQLSLTPLTIENLPGVQSFVFGQHEGKWLIIGGRLDGLHLRQPPFTFDIPGHNTNFMVVDPESGQFWMAPTDNLPESHREQLSATNMLFHQEGNTLFAVGGYGFSPTAADHTTYPYLTAIQVEEVIDAIINGVDYGDFITQYYDEQFAITGGYFKAIGDTFYLAGGQRFEGRYNPMGPNHGPGFFQEYTNAIRRFTIEDKSNLEGITFLPEWFDSLQLHRRDYNVVDQIFPDGSMGFTAFSGVFQLEQDIPFLNCVDVHPDGYAPVPNFAQYFNHYHCAHTALYDATTMSMHNVFFGGIAQYYMENGVLIQDDEVPFVRTIARVTRTADYQMQEYKLPLEMPDYLGASAEFIPVADMPMYDNGVIKLDSLQGDSVLIGYIYGGIQSDLPNIFFINDGSQSIAYANILRVYLHPGGTTATDELNAQSSDGLFLQVYPNPVSGDFSIRFTADQYESILLRVTDTLGAQVMESRLEDATPGVNTYNISLGSGVGAGVYLVTIWVDGKQTTQQVILR